MILSISINLMNQLNCIYLLNFIPKNIACKIQLQKQLIRQLIVEKQKINKFSGHKHLV